MVSFAQTSSDWDASGDLSSLTASPLFTILPWAFALFVGICLVRAYRARSRYRAVNVMTPAELDRVRAAIRDIEAGTSAEVVPVVVERSDPQTHTLLLGAATFALLANICLLPWLPARGFVALGGAELLLITLGLGFTQICTDYRRWFLSSVRADATAGEQALIELSRLSRGLDPASALVVVFVSLFEHRVVVLASGPAVEAHGPARWPEVVERVLGGVRAGRLGDGLVAGLEASARGMEVAFPPGPERQNRLADAAIVRRE